MHIVFWGTYDTGKPRVRILLQGLRENGVEVSECQANIWENVEDKSQLSGTVNKLKFFFKWVASYPGLIFRYMKLPKHDVVVIGYMGHFDVIVLWLFARIRGTPIVWDAFLSLYNTVVEDRMLLSRLNPLAILLYAWEWTACHAAGTILLDTRAHADYFITRYSIRYDRVHPIFVGAENKIFFPLVPANTPDEGYDGITVLFYGQFIPLHGIETIVHAAKLLDDHPIKWQIIGQGQEAPRIKQLIDQYARLNVDWIPWIPYEELNTWINRADICLGIFGATEKARMVIPNKVFQIVAAGKPLVTMDSPAIRELIDPDMSGVRLVPENNPEALSRAVLEFSDVLVQTRNRNWHTDIQIRITPETIGRDLLSIIQRK